jgi:hypothetical protein
MLPTKLWFIWPSGFRGEDLKKLTNQKQELPLTAMLVNGRQFLFLIGRFKKKSSLKLLGQMN